MRTAAVYEVALDSSTNSRSSVFQCLLSAVMLWKPLQPEFFQRVDWTQVVSSADHHGVLPILAQRVLSELSIDSVVRTSLRSSLSATTKRSLPLADEILRISNLFRQHGVRVIPYKGPVLAEELWGSFSLRECSDLDFLVPVGQVDRAGELLEELNYVRITPIPKHLRPTLTRNASEEQFRHRDRKVLLELQWAPAPSVFAIDYDERSLWSNAHEIAFAGGSVLAPSSEDLFLLLCIHGWKHNWSRLIWLGDIAQLLHTTQLDWSRVFVEAAKNRQTNMVSLALLLANRCFDTPLPAECVQSRKLIRVADELLGCMQSNERCSYVKWHRYMLAARDSHNDQIHQVSRFLFTPGLGEYGAIALPGWASAGYRLVRLSRVLRLFPGKAQEQ
jgi:Uncharacterised nucleotidyltransferase